MAAPTTTIETTEQRRSTARRLLNAREPKARFGDLDRSTRRFIAGSLLTLVTSIILGVYLLPLVFMTATSLKSEEQIALSTVLPRAARTVDYAIQDVDLVEVRSADGALAAITVAPAGEGGADAIPFTWSGSWDGLLARLDEAGADPAEVELVTGGPDDGLSIVLPGTDALALLSGDAAPTELAFDGTEDGLLAALAEVGYQLDQVALFTMPPFDDGTGTAQVTAMALLRPGAAVNALVDPALLPARTTWDASVADLDTQLQAILGVPLAEVSLHAVPDASGTFSGVGLLTPGADAATFLDPGSTVPETIEWERTTSGLSAALDAALGVEPRELELFSVPLPDGSVRSLALLQPGPSASVFIDPADPSAEPIRWEGRVNTLEPITDFAPTVENFPDAWDRIDFGRKLRNTAIIAGLGMAGTVLSSTLVAYGLSRFRIPFKNLILLSLVATIILPRFVTLVPTYIVFERIGWVGTWWPLIVPHFFANAYNVFLLRQFFLTIPRDLDEAAAIDGAGPLTVLATVILPQARGAILAVALFHFFFAWNDFLEPLLYLSTRPDRQPIAVGLYFFLGLYDDNLPLIQSGALIGMAIPILVFLLLQKVFLSGIDLSGSMK